ncbi:hypothetical protein GGTG_11789 [Gaeumannomyces tritici R3-111a-1]|uniref:Uncharacterized protein n=1 Tax=Gaeumannomyces tritici (strain R3-111a-1) TaxID=644352 RepID=J3PE66_GAET3|nr:hypothetical protein GGTG_11789 [Gaeumannomyces tritici R3-111a-1]EJT70766.1 hypothetical protein GGTG_11789 [Gaeumannomyces tritici R3-111a-1]
MLCGQPDLAESENSSISHLAVEPRLPGFDVWFSGAIALQPGTPSPVKQSRTSAPHGPGLASSLAVPDHRGVSGLCGFLACCSLLLLLANPILPDAQEFQPSRPSQGGE